MPIEKLSFEEWKARAIQYVHIITGTEGDEFMWLLGDDEDMKRDGYDDEQTPEAYVDYQIECAE